MILFHSFQRFLLIKSLKLKGNVLMLGF